MTPAAIIELFREVNAAPPVRVGVVPPLMAPCGHCFGTGTVFHGRALKVGNSRKCPVCKGACKLPAIEAISTYRKEP